MFRSIEDSLKQLEYSSRVGEVLLDDEDISNLWQVVKSYQAELAIQDREIALLEEKTNIMRDYINNLENTYRVAKEEK